MRRDFISIITYITFNLAVITLSYYFAMISIGVLVLSSHTIIRTNGKQTTVLVLMWDIAFSYLLITEVIHKEISTSVTVLI